jgi:hypothetical protein
MSENLFCSKLFSEVYNTKTILPDTVTLDNLVTAIIESPTVIPKIQDSGNSVIEILRKHKYIHE